MGRPRSSAVVGTLALVGSGEYLPVMSDLEGDLFQAGVANGRRPIYVQFATAAGNESSDRIQYWRDLGAQQAKRIGSEVDFIPVFSRSDVDDEHFIKRASDAALIYFSGGDPHHLAETMRGTRLWEAVVSNYRAGGSLAGCSAGAMFLSATVPSLRFMHREPVAGVGLLPHLQVIPHFDRFTKFVPDMAVKAMTKIPEGVTLVGIDEETALVKTDEWKVWGTGQVHLLNGPNTGRFAAAESVPLSN